MCNCSATNYITKKKFYKAKNDSMFKAIFCNENNRDLLERLIEDTLKMKVKIK